MFIATNKTGPTSRLLFHYMGGRILYWWKKLAAKESVCHCSLFHVNTKFKKSNPVKVAQDTVVCSLSAKWKKSKHHNLEVHRMTVTKSDEPKKLQDAHVPLHRTPGMSLHVNGHAFYPWIKGAHQWCVQMGARGARAIPSRLKKKGGGGRKT